VNEQCGTLQRLAYTLEPIKPLTKEIDGKCFAQNSQQIGIISLCNPHRVGISRDKTRPHQILSISSDVFKWVPSFYFETKLFDSQLKLISFHSMSTNILAVKLPFIVLHLLQEMDIYIQFVIRVES
jgi:hypothetical protein